MRRFLLSVSLLALLAQAVHAQTIWYVDGDALTNGFGTGWGSPFNNLPSALTAASNLNDPQDEIWVKASTLPYTPASTTSTFQLEANVGVYGGFDGTETSRNERDFLNNETILSGELGSPGHGDNVENIVTGATGNSTFVLDGFTITGADNHGIFNSTGANGLYRNLIIEDNDSLYDGFGAGMWVQNSNPVIISCTIQNNQVSIATSGGAGLYILESSPLIQDCTFEGNELLGGSPHIPTGGIGGGGGAVVEGGAPRFFSCRFRNNRTINGFGGGLAVESGEGVIVALCSFTDNIVEITNSDADQGGGGLATHHPISVMNCSFRRNTVRDDSLDLFGMGGGAYFIKDATVTNCEFIDNSAGQGGGIAFGNLFDFEHAVLLRNATIVRNIAGDEGGGYGFIPTKPTMLPSFATSLPGTIPPIAMTHAPRTKSTRFGSTTRTPVSPLRTPTS